MNKADEEIISILKETFAPKKRDFKDPDDSFRELILKLLLGISVFGIVMSIVLNLLGKDLPPGLQVGISTPSAIFFGLLFLHINNRACPRTYLGRLSIIENPRWIFQLSGSCPYYRS